MNTHSGFPILYNSDDKKNMGKTVTLGKLCPVVVLYMAVITQVLISHTRTGEVGDTLAAWP